MDTTKKGIIKAGAIIAIVIAVLTLISGASIFGTAGEIITENSIVEIIKQEEGYTYVEDGESYFIEYEEDGVAVRITKDDLLVTVKLVRRVVNVFLIISLVLAGVCILVANSLLKSAEQGKRCTGKIIALMIMSIFLGNMATFVLMIVALCIKDKKITLENVNDYYVEDKFE